MFPTSSEWSNLRWQGKESVHGNAAAGLRDALAIPYTSCNGHEVTLSEHHDISVISSCGYRDDQEPEVHNAFLNFLAP
jgi:hypothetical protein